ncbi:hypothetical protein [Catenuloplanes atrovinosus]|uniref:Uncharacterized protein n=1 Tax=Catenuloplanes atrovinosus TaxID=137266 RepID=A0AAE3YQ71_9ACTN|nr:hypothetical protein [Catenuloplanes atrovinosus]MDR7277655.1 hypothetical protein [Catenuloplanes atrovinosus]
MSDAFEDRANHLDTRRRWRVVQLERKVRGVIVAERLDIPGAHNGVNLPGLRSPHAAAR